MEIIVNAVEENTMENAYPRLGQMDHQARKEETHHIHQNQLP